MKKRRNSYDGAIDVNRNGFHVCHNDVDENLGKKKVEMERKFEVSIKKGKTKCEKCPFDSVSAGECVNIPYILFGVDCQEYDLSKMKVTSKEKNDEKKV